MCVQVLNNRKHRPTWSCHDMSCSQKSTCRRVNKVRATKVRQHASEQSKKQVPCIRPRIIQSARPGKHLQTRVFVPTMVMARIAATTLAGTVRGSPVWMCGTVTPSGGMTSESSGSCLSIFSYTRSCLSQCEV